ncbi:MAG: M20 family metallopeptidase [Anaerolineae bacterium]
MILDELLRQADDCLDETAALLAELVRIPSVNAGESGPGNETEVCQHLARKLAQEGIRSQVLEMAPGRGNLVTRIGGGSGPRLLYMSHTDVVPAEDADEWRFPPFAGTIAEGCVHGRGAADCKALAAAGSMALIILSRSRITLAGDLILVAAADEETGGRLGLGWLTQAYPNLIKADYAINEGGGATFYVGNRPGYILNTGEKGRLEASLRVQGRSGHAAAPWAADNPIGHLGDVLSHLRQYKQLPDLSHPIFEAVREVFTADIGHLLQANYDLATKAERGIISALRGAAYMTITPTMVAAGVKSNAIPSACHLTCDIRTLPGQTQSYVERELTTLLAGISGIEIAVKETAEASASLYPTAFSEAMKRATACAVARDDLIWLPGLTAGFTDSRFVRRLGTTVYNFAPQALDPNIGTPEGVHGRDERMPIESLRVLLRMLVALAWDILGACR